MALYPVTMGPNFTINIDINPRDPEYKKILEVPRTKGSATSITLPGEIVLWRQAVRQSGRQLDPDNSVVSYILQLSNECDDLIQKGKEFRSCGKVNGFNWLYSYQYHGITFLSSAKSAILADDMGLGKTATVISTLKRISSSPYTYDAQCFPALVVAPNSLLHNWKNEIEKFGQTTMRATVVEGTKAKKQKIIEDFIENNRIGDAHTVLIVSYETAKMFSGHLHYGKQKKKPDGPLNDTRWYTVIVDEGHKIINPKTQQTRAVWRLGITAAYRFVLTGTPIRNQIDDLWSLLRFCDPQLFPSKQQFIDYWCKSWQPPWGGIQVEGIKPELKSEFDLMIGTKMRRIQKSLVMRDLPDKLYQEISVPMSTKQARSYKQMKKEFIAEIDGGYLEASKQIAQWGRLMQIAQGEYAEDENGELFLKKSNKVDALLDIVESRDGKGTVVFSDSLPVLKLAHETLVDKGYAAKIIVGDTPIEERQKHVDLFQSGLTEVLLCSLRTMNAGVTLTAADTMVFLHRSWSMVEQQQAENRIHRIGAESDSVHYISLVTDKTVESKQGDVLDGKFGTLQEVFRDKELLKELLDE